MATDHIPPLDSTNIDIQQQREVYELGTRLYELERDIRQFLTNDAQLKRNYNDLREFKVRRVKQRRSSIKLQCVLEKVEAFFDVHLEDRAKTELGADGINDLVSSFIRNNNKVIVLRARH